MSDATIEVGGEVYELASSTMHDNTQTYTTGSGERYAMRLGAQSLDATTTDPRARALVHKGAVRCRVELYGATYTGYVELVRWSAGFASIDLRVHDLKPIPVAPTLGKSIGKFTAPGTGDIGVLGIEFTHDFATGTKEGVVRLEKRPYWEGGATPFTLETPATSEYEAMHLTGLWIGRGDFDGDGCNITVTGVTMRAAAPAAPTLDELTDPADLDWGTIRSTCAARDWRAAWGVVGTDHTGDATPGEVYLLAVARRASATAAALHHWRKAEMESGTIFSAAARAAWARIKRIAAWESSAVAQYVKRPPSAKQKRMEWLNERIRPGAFQLPDDILGGRYSTVNVGDLVIDDPVGSFEEAWWHAMADSATQARLYGRDNVSNEAPLDAARQRAEDDAVTRGNGGVPGVLNNPYLSAAAQRDMIHFSDMHVGGTSATIATALERYASLTGNAMNVQGNGRGGIVVTPRNTNPAPRGPQTRKRR